MKVRVFGVQRAGTNYLEQLINQNTLLSATAGNLKSGLWKHSAFPERKHFQMCDIHLVLSKNPFKWLESLHRYNADLSKRSGKYHENLFTNK